MIRDHLFLTVFFLLAGCAAKVATTGMEEVPPPPPPAREEAAAPRDAIDVLIDGYRQAAAQAEKQGDLRRSLEKWEVVADFRPGNRVARERVRALGEQLARSADDHFHKGQAFLKKDKPKAARREFLLALADHPGHAGALEYLKNTLVRRSEIHLVQGAETLEQIAQTKYGDPSLAYLVAKLNDLEKGSVLRQGQKIVLPFLDDMEIAPPAAAPPAAADAVSSAPAEPEAVEAAGIADPYFDDDRLQPSQEEIVLAHAQTSFDEGQYREAIAGASDVLENSTIGDSARQLINASYYNIGKELARKGEYVDALDAYWQVEGGYRDIEKTVADLRKLMLKAAEEHYIAGVQFFVEQKLPQAIAEWEKTLALNPDHPKAAKDMKKAEKLADRLQKVQ